MRLNEEMAAGIESDLLLTRSLIEHLDAELTARKLGVADVEQALLRVRADEKALRSALWYYRQWTEEAEAALAPAIEPKPPSREEAAAESDSPERGLLFKTVWSGRLG